MGIKPSCLPSEKSLPRQQGEIHPRPGRKGRLSLVLAQEGSLGDLVCCIVYEGLFASFRD